MDNDIISNPSHYTEGRKYEPRKVIEDWDLDFYLGNAVKYISGSSSEIAEKHLLHILLSILFSCLKLHLAVSS